MTNRLPGTTTNLGRTELMPNRMDHVDAKTKGAAKSVKAHAEGLTGLFATLAKQHGEASSLLYALFSDIKKNKKQKPQNQTVLLSHDRAEMRVLYSELRM